MKHRFVIIAVVIQAVCIAGITIKAHAPFWFGKSYTISTRPVDPRDLFLGNFVQLRFSLNQLQNLTITGATGELEAGTVVYVSFSAEEQDLKPTGINLTAPTEGAFIRGHLVSRYTPAYGFPRIEYGIERYYTGAEPALQLERSRTSLIADIVVAPNGEARIETVR